MLKKFLLSLEDPEAPLLGPNIWILKKIGFLLPNNYLGKVIYIIIHQIVTFFVITQYIELFFIWDDIDMVLTNLKVSMLSIVCVTKSNTCIVWQSKWRKMMEYVNLSDKYERDTRDVARGKILDSYTKYCRSVTYLYWFLVFITFIATSSTPLVFLSQKSFREVLKNETVLFPHIFSSWVPFDKNHSPGIWINITLQIFFCAYGATLMGAYDSTAIVIMVYLGGKMELLRERCKQMLGCDGRSVSDERALELMKELHKTYVLLTKNYRIFNSLLSPVMFLYVVMCSLMLCASTYQLTSTNNATQKLLLAEYLIFGVAQLFVFCWHSNDVLNKSADVMSGPYHSQWWMASIAQRKGVLTLAGQLQVRHIFTGGPFTELQLATFLAILKGAYSYYTLLRK